MGLLQQSTSNTTRWPVRTSTKRIEKVKLIQAPFSQFSLPDVPYQHQHQLLLQAKPKAPGPASCAGAGPGPGPSGSPGPIPAPHCESYSFSVSFYMCAVCSPDPKAVLHCYALDHITPRGSRAPTFRSTLHLPFTCSPCSWT